MLFSGQANRAGRNLLKHEVLEITFQLYPPKGTGIGNTRKSTWMYPIINGEEAVKLIGTYQNLCVPRESSVYVYCG